MISLSDVIWLAIFFFGTLIVLALLRPIFVLQRDRQTGRPIDNIDGTKLLGWTILFSVIMFLIYLVITKCNCIMNGGSSHIVY